MILAAFRKYNIGEKETLIHQVGETVYQPVIIKREATEEEYLECWKSHPDFDETAFKSNGYRIVGYYEVYSD